MSEDKIIDCCDCSDPFTFTAAEQDFYASKGLAEPRRCKGCRMKRKAARGESSGGDRQMFDAVCSDCGQACQVPFQPNGEKPVYCRPCFIQRNPR